MGCTFTCVYLQVVQHSKGGHARGRGPEQGFQDGRSTGLVLLLGGHRWRTRACTLAKCEKCLLQIRHQREKKKSMYKPER